MAYIVGPLLIKTYTYGIGISTDSPVTWLTAPIYQMGMLAVNLTNHSSTHVSQVVCQACMAAINVGLSPFPTELRDASSSSSRSRSSSCRRRRSEELSDIFRRGQANPTAAGCPMRRTRSRRRSPASRADGTGSAVQHPLVGECEELFEATSQLQTSSDRIVAESLQQLRMFKQI